MILHKAIPPKINAKEVLGIYPPPIQKPFQWLKYWNALLMILSVFIKKIRQNNTVCVNTELEAMQLVLLQMIEELKICKGKCKWEVSSIQIQPTKQADLY